MPELPEVETIRLKLEKTIVGKIISEIVAHTPKSLIGDPKLVIGKNIIGVKRIGKMLVINMEGEMEIGIHLKMSGQLMFLNYELRITNQEKRLNNKHLRVKIIFKDGDSLNFIDQRKFGWVWIIKNYELKIMNYVKNLGKEPWDITDEEFYETVHKRNRPIKLVILDQEIISGVGNIYANDSLWEASINPMKKARELRLQDSKTLRKSIIKVLKEGIKYGGSTGKDKKYVHPDGGFGSYQDHFRVYERVGLPCLRNDGGIIKKVKLGGRGTYYCPVCQKLYD
jgi:formamidopyrimidine-DNA glycosylase